MPRGPSRCQRQGFPARWPGWGQEAWQPWPPRGSLGRPSVHNGLCSVARACSLPLDSLT